MTRVAPQASANLVAGVDEAGRGPLAGPVCAAAVVLDQARPLQGLRDSKKLSPARRTEMAAVIRQGALAWAVAWADVEEIERVNVLQASLAAMRRAVEALALRPQRVQFDGPYCPRFDGALSGSHCEAVIGGDSRLDAISAASILAKVYRDLEMCRLDLVYPGYGFAAHKGYGTRAHLSALRRLGPCPVHRASYAPVRAAARRADGR